MAKIDEDVPPAVKMAQWMGVAADAGATLMRGANFTLRQMITRTASRLDVAESAIRVDYGKQKTGHWAWTAKLVRDEHSGDKVRRMVEEREAADDPMTALGRLVERVESK